MKSQVLLTGKPSRAISSSTLFSQPAWRARRRPFIHNMRERAEWAMLLRRLSCPDHFIYVDLARQIKGASRSRGTSSWACTGVGAVPVGPKHPERGGAVAWDGSGERRKEGEREDGCLRVLCSAGRSKSCRRTGKLVCVLLQVGSLVLPDRFPNGTKWTILQLH